MAYVRASSTEGLDKTPKNQEPTIDPKVAGLSLEGHPQKGPPIYRNSHLRLSVRPSPTPALPLLAPPVKWPYKQSRAFLGPPAWAIVGLPAFGQSRVETNCSGFLYVCTYIYIYTTYNTYVRTYVHTYMYTMYRAMQTSTYVSICASGAQKTPLGSRVELGNASSIHFSGPQKTT